MRSIADHIRTLHAEHEPVQLHLGCGKRHLPGFLHLDLDSYPHIDQLSNVADLSAIPDASVDLIYACHVLEYFDSLEAGAVLREWCRVLKKGAVLRVSVPDFDKIIEAYRKYDDMALLYGFLYGRYVQAESGHDPIYHRMVYTHRSLRDHLLGAGFDSVRRYDWKDTIHKDHDDYSQAYIPHMHKDTGLLMSLNVEAFK